MIKHQREVYSWEFLFLGANQDAIKAGPEIGIAPASSVTFSAEPGGTAQAFAAVACASAAYRAGEENYADHLKKAAKKGKA